MFTNIMRSKRSNIEFAFEELIKLRQFFSNPWLLLVNSMKYLKHVPKYFDASRIYASYSGRYEIHKEKVTHHVEVSLVREWSGTDLERTFELIGNRLLLVTPSFEGTSHYLNWERV